PRACPANRGQSNAIEQEQVTHEPDTKRNAIRQKLQARLALRCLAGDGPDVWRIEQVTDDFPRVLDITPELSADHNHDQGDYAADECRRTEGVKNNAQALAETEESPDPGPKAHLHFHIAGAHAANGIDGQEQG